MFKGGHREQTNVIAGGTKERVGIAAVQAAVEGSLSHLRCVIFQRYVVVKGM